MKKLRGCLVWVVGIFAVMVVIGIWAGGNGPATVDAPLRAVPTFTSTVAPATVQPAIVEPTAVIVPPTATMGVVLLPTATPLPVIVEPTATTVPPTATTEPPTAVPTDTPVPVQPPDTPTPATRSEGIVLPAAVCDCSGDSKNCGDFTRRPEAQACFDYCMATVGTDVHRLDANDDRVACESLPN